MRPFLWSVALAERTKHEQRKNMSIISISKPARATPTFGLEVVVAFILAATLLMSVGCDGSGGAEKSRAKLAQLRKDHSPEEAEMARVKLAQLGKDYSPEDFVRCASKGDAIAVNLFLDAGMSANARVTIADGKEMCALFAGCVINDEAVIKVLLERGANPNDLSLDGKAPLWAAIVNTNFNMVRLLVDKGAKLDCLNPESEFTPLGTAAQHGAVDIMDFLLNNGAGVNEGGHTPLLWSVWSGNVEAVKLLLNHKPNLEIRNATDHITAMDLARKKGFEEIVALLRNAGAVYSTESYIDRSTAVDTLGEAARTGNAKLAQETEKQIINQIKRMSVEEPDPKKRLEELAEWHNQDFAVRMTQGARLQQINRDHPDEAMAQNWLDHGREIQKALDILVRQMEKDAQLEIEKNQTGGNSAVAQMPAPPSEADRKLLADTRAKAESGDAQSQELIGNILHLGLLGVATDDREAVKWYRKAAEQNYREAQVDLGICYDNGRGVARDETEAVKWYRKAAEQNDAYAQFFLGGCYAGGRSVAIDYVEAYKWNVLASTQGDEGATKMVTLLESSMSQEHIAEGQKLARNFKPVCSIR